MTIKIANVDTNDIRKEIGLAAEEALLCYKSQSGSIYIFCKMCVCLSLCHGWHVQYYNVYMLHTRLNRVFPFHIFVSLVIVNILLFAFQEEPTRVQNKYRRIWYKQINMVISVELCRKRWLARTSYGKWYEQGEWGIPSGNVYFTDMLASFTYLIRIQQKIVIIDINL